MKYITVVLLIILCMIGVVALVLINRDKSQYADGEPTAILKNWLERQPINTLAISVNASTSLDIDKVIVDDQGQAIWTEEYLGNGKWLVSKANLPASNNENLTFEEWIAKIRGWDENRLNEYESDLSPEDQYTFQAQLRTYNSGQQDSDAIEKWHIYEKSGLVEKVK
jgi:hypothetical protein